MGKTNSKGRGNLSPQQSQQLIDSIQKIQIGNEGLSKAAVVLKAATETFGAEQTEWPVKMSSSAVDRYWRRAFPSESVSLGKKRGKYKKHRSAQPLIDDLRRSPAAPVVVKEGYKKIVCICPECNTLIKIETTKLS